MSNPERLQFVSESEKPIAIFDSGVGGLTVLHKALQQLPLEKFIYYADTEHVPYGIKPKEEIQDYVLDATSFLNKIGIKALLIACNTATSIAVQELRNIYSFPVFGMEPAVKPAIEKTIDRRVLVLATPLTLQEQKFKDLVTRIDNENIVDSFPFPELVDLAERFIFEEENVLPVIKNRLREINLSSYGTVVLGCTHFIFFKKIIAKLFPPFTDVIDGNEGTVRHLKNVLNSGPPLSEKKKKGTVRYFNSGFEAGIDRFEKYLSFLEHHE